MAGLLDYLNEQKESAMKDYTGLLGAYPNANKALGLLFSQIENNFQPVRCR
jgi:hypothetical protein